MNNEEETKVFEVKKKPTQVNNEGFAKPKPNAIHITMDNGAVYEIPLSIFRDEELEGIEDVATWAKEHITREDWTEFARMVIQPKRKPFDLFQDAEAEAIKAV